MYERVSVRVRACVRSCACLCAEAPSPPPLSSAVSLALLLMQAPPFKAHDSAQNIDFPPPSLPTRNSMLLLPFDACTFVLPDLRQSWALTKLGLLLLLFCLYLHHSLCSLSPSPLIPTIQPKRCMPPSTQASKKKAIRIFVADGYRRRNWRQEVGHTQQKLQKVLL